MNVNITSPDFRLVSGQLWEEDERRFLCGIGEDWIVEKELKGEVYIYSLLHKSWKHAKITVSSPSRLKKVYAGLIAECDDPENERSQFVYFLLKGKVLGDVR